MSGSGQLRGNTALGFPFSIFWKDSLGTETHLISSSISNPFSVFLSLLLSLLLSCHLCLLLCLIFKSCCSSCFILHSLFLTLSLLSLSNCIYRMETEICPCQKLPHSQTQPKLLFWALSIPVLLDSYFHLDRSKTHGTHPPSIAISPISLPTMHTIARARNLGTILPAHPQAFPLHNQD